MNWTRCADALPDCPSPEIWDYASESEPVLIFDRWGHRQLAVLRTINDDDADPENPPRDWRLIGLDGYTLEMSDVTHWHPLPGAPTP